MENRQKIARNVKIFALIGLTLGLLGFTPMIGLYFSLVSSILFIIVFYKLKVHAGAKNLFSNLFSMVGIIIFSGIIGAILIQGAEQLTAIVLKLLLSVIILIVFYKFSKNIFYEIARVTHQKYFIRAFYTGFIGILVFIVGMGLFLWNLEIRIINLDFIPMGGNMGFTPMSSIMSLSPMSSNIDFKSIFILAVASILLCVGVIFSLINFIYHALAWLNFESFDEGVKEENYTTTTQGLKLIKIIMIFALISNFLIVYNFIFHYIFFSEIEVFNFESIFSPKAIAIVLECLFCIFSFISILLLCKKIRSYKMLLFFTLWVVFDCITFIPLFDYFTSFYGFFLCRTLFVITSAFFFFKELVKISSMKIFFVVYIFFFAYHFYPIDNVLVISQLEDLMKFFGLNDFIKVYLKSFIMFFDLEKFTYFRINLNCIYIILFIIAWSRLKIKIMPKA
ncbi:hypothetical protein [Campylobacter taeniopygiae]|uniref:Uncharacterized protein n=1 Tax=Campylobacter taeniopygiae TaxID=2510188 RepID=A0ABY2TLG1_9BACT|nr:hypothetical protein [Campylobacter taeniopygiae]TKX34722.1 hypothetical protein CQA75_00275 [Campylobacter taeniopygiae]